MNRNRSRLDRIERAIAAANSVPPETVLLLEPGETEVQAFDRYATCGRVLAPAVVVAPAEAPSSEAWAGIADVLTIRPKPTTPDFATSGPPAAVPVPAATSEPPEASARHGVPEGETEASPSDEPRGAALLPGTVAGYRVIW